MKSRSDENALLLAYYFGNLQVLNCVALESITSDLIDNFLTPPSNNTTKYSGHVDGCCICHEKEVLFKRVLKHYYRSSASSYSTSEPTLPDIDKCWKEIEKIWQSHAIVQNWDEKPVGCVAPNYKIDCIGLLSKHKVFLHQASTQKSEKRWKSLLTSVKKGLERCIDSIAKINKGKLDVTPLASQCPNFSKKRLRNAYLTLMISKGARTQAKFLQSCREIGVQIRAARDPVAVVCKYTICGKCLEKPNRHKIVNVADILKYSVMDFPAAVPYNRLPDHNEKLRSEKIKLKPIARSKQLPSVEVTFCSPKRMAANAAVNSGTVSKCEPIYILKNSLKNSPTPVFGPPGINPLKRKLGMPVAEAKKFCLQAGSYDKESLNVVIVGDNHQTTTPVTGLVPSDHNTPKISKSSQPISIKSLKVINTQVKSPNGSTKILSTHGQLPVQNKLSLGNSTQQSDRLPITKINPRSVFQPSLAPVNVMEMRKIPTRASVANVPKKPFVVQIIDNRLANSTALLKEFKANQPLPVIKTIPLSNGGIKFVKAVSLSNRTPKTPSGAILVKGFKLPNSAVAPASATTVFGRNGLHAMQPVKVVSAKFKSSVGKGALYSNKGALYSNKGLTAAYRPMEKFHPLGQYFPVINVDTVTAQAQNDGSKKLGSSQLKMANRTPSKKRNRTSFPSKPISTVVAEYLLSLTPSADKDLWRKLKTRTKRRWEKTSSMIPVPYETHFLCIDNTIKKLGWKAYWYRKCRCSKIREKSTADSDFPKGHSIEDMKDWIPAAVTEPMREELANAFEREDNYTSPTTNGCSTLRETIAGTNTVSTQKKGMNDKTQIDLSRVKLEFNPPLPQPSSTKPAESSNCILEQTNVKNHSSTSNKAPPVTLKAKYYRGKNGLWKSMNKGADRSPHKEPLGVGSQSRSANCVKLNLGSAFVEEPKDSFGSLNVDGLRRCPRATMLRRKSLIDRAERFERNTKAKRQRTESYATENFIFSSTCNPSAHEQGFSVITPHPVVFKECEDLQALFQVIANGKSSLKLNVCKRQSNAAHEQQRQEKYYENIISSIMQNVTANVGNFESKPNPKKSDQLKPKNQKCQLLSELEVAWDKSNADNDGSAVGTPTLRSDRQRPLKKSSHKRCIMQIKPELMYNSLQMLRGVPSSEPSTNLISQESAEFVASALKIRRGSSKLESSGIHEEETGIHCSDVEFTYCEHRKSLTSDNEAASSTTSVAQLQDSHNDKVENDVSTTTSVIPKVSALPNGKTDGSVKQKSVNNDGIKVPSTGAIFYRLNHPFPYRNSPRQFKGLADGCLSLPSFQGKLSRYFKSCQTLSCLLGNSSVLRLEEDLIDWNDVSSHTKHYIDDPKMESHDNFDQPTVQVNKRKRPATLKGVQGLDGADGNAVALPGLQAEGCDGDEFTYERPMTALLSKDLDVASLKHCMWETTSARPIGLHRKYYTRRTDFVALKKVLVGQPCVNNASKVEDRKSAADPPVGLSDANVPQNATAPYLRQSLMLIKPSPRKNPIHKRPQGISHARMMYPPCVAQTTNGETDEANDNDSNVPSNGFSPPREICGKELLRILQPRKVRSSERLKGNGDVCSPTGSTNVQVLRETVFAELQSKKRRRSDKEDIKECESTNSDRKLNRFSTNGNFISRLLEIDSEQFTFDNS